MDTATATIEEKPPVLNWIIRTSLQHRVLVLVGAALMGVYGMYTAVNLPTDVLPDLNRPVVTIMTEAPGLAPEEVEAQVTYYIETAVNGAAGVDRVRSVSSLGLSIVFVEFDWGTDIRVNRQTVQERLATVGEKMPEGVTPMMGPIASIMGEIMLVGVQSPTQSPMEVRTLAEWVIRPALLSIGGVSQVTVMGGELKQFQVRADPDRLRLFDLTLEDLEKALGESNQNTGGGFVIGPSGELVVRNIGRVQTAQDIENSLVAMHRGDDPGPPRPVLVKDVANVVEAGTTIKRGEGSVNASPAVIMAVQKQPSADTRLLTERIDAAIASLKSSLPQDLIVNADLFRQSHFIETAIHNVLEVLRDGSFLVVVVLVLFLMNVRTTLVTLTALPLSLVITSLVFAAFGMSINTMTLGGIAVAIGELVDDAVVDVENVFRRLRENRTAGNPKSAMRVVYEASSEVRNPILMGTIIVNIVFLPTFFLSGVEGRLFQPLALGYIISIFASLLVALTVTPVLSYFVLPGAKRMEHTKDGPVLRGFKWLAQRAYEVALPRPITVITACAILVVIGGFLVSRMGREFLPAFNEGTATVSVVTIPGVSLPESDRLGRKAEELLLAIPEVKSVGRRTGRAEQDEHAEGVHSAEIDVDFWSEEQAEKPEGHTTLNGRNPPDSMRPRTEVFQEMGLKLAMLPGVVVSIGQPISHRIDHLLSGVRAQVAVKVFGEDLGQLRGLAQQVQAAMNGIEGVVDLQVEQQVLVPQLHISVDRQAAARYGFTPAQLTDTLEAAIKGKVVSQVLQGLRSFDLVVTFGEAWRNDPERLKDVRLISPTGAVVLVSDVADIREVTGPNQISRENLLRRIVISCNVRGRDLGTTVDEITESIAMDVKLPQGYTIALGGQFEAQREATRLLTILGIASLAAVFVLLYSHYRSSMIATQVMLNVPFAFIGSVAVLYLAGEPLSVASLVGFISLTGIAIRNGVLMISHYIHLRVHEGVPFSREMVIRGSQERVAPVLMTALTAMLGLVPLALSKGEPGKEILYPVALVILGGLFTSTALDFFVTPTVFLRFGRNAIERLALMQHEHADLVLHDDTHVTPRSDGQAEAVATLHNRSADETPIGKESP